MKSLPEVLAAGRRFAFVVAAAAGLAVVTFRTRDQDNLYLSDITLLILSLGWLGAAAAIAADTATADRLDLRLRGAFRWWWIPLLGIFLAGISMLPGFNWGWVLLGLGFSHVVLASRRPEGAAPALALLAATCLLFAEGSLALMVHFPSLSRIPAVRPLARHLYLSRFTAIQMLDDCARYDPALSYTLKPGSCVFENTEFRTTYTINFQGLRDDEDALRGPEVIALGDSYTMGWGVEQDEAFPQVFESLTGRRTLNAGVSSYGTVREMRLLERINTHSLRRLLLQYSANDFAENRTYRDSGDSLPVMSADDLDRLRRDHAVRQGYRFPIYVYQSYARWFCRPAASWLHQMGWPRPEPAEFAKQYGGRNPRWREESARQDEVDLFLHVLETAAADLSAASILIFQPQEMIPQTSWFVPSLRKRLEGLGDGSPYRRIEVLDLAGVLTAEDFFRLDGHLNASGHRKVAEALAARISRLDAE